MDRMTESSPTFECSGCGQPMHVVAPLPPLQRFAHWFNYGATPRGQVNHRCPHCGAGMDKLAVPTRRYRDWPHTPTAKQPLG